VGFDSNGSSDLSIRTDLVCFGPTTEESTDTGFASAVELTFAWIADLAASIGRKEEVFFDEETGAGFIPFDSFYRALQYCNCLTGKQSGLLTTLRTGSWDKLSYLSGYACLTRRFHT